MLDNLLIYKSNFVRQGNMKFLEELTTKWKKSPLKPVRIIAFGSSNTELHWHSLGHFNWFSWLSCAMREWIGRHVTLINAGINGETAESLLKRIERDVLSLSPDATIITIGGNDALLKFPVDQYRKNLLTIINIIREAEILPILQTYYCPLYKKMPESFSIFKKFVEVNRNLSTEKGIPIIDQYKYFLPLYENEPEVYSELMNDGLHVNPIGNSIMGIIACRHFSLPDPIFMNRTFRKKVRKYLNLMNRYTEFLPKIKKT